MKALFLQAVIILTIVSTTTSCAGNKRDTEPTDPETIVDQPTPTPSSTAAEDELAAQRRALQAELEGYQLQRNSVVSEINALKQHFAGYYTEKQHLESELEDYRRKVKAYLMDHKMAVAAIVLGVAGTDVAIDKDNEFSEEAEEYAAIGATIAVIYALANMEEVSKVFDVINQADSYVKDAENRIAVLNRTMVETEEKISWQNNELNRYDSLIASVQNRL
jgi:chromosome segregation ATPase